MSWSDSRKTAISACWNSLFAQQRLACLYSVACVSQCLKSFPFLPAPWGKTRPNNCDTHQVTLRMCVCVTVHGVCDRTVQIAPFIGKLSFGSVWNLGFRLSSLFKGKRSLCGVTFSFPRFLSRVYLITRWHLMPAWIECTIAKFRFFFSSIPFERWQRLVRLISVWTAAPSCLWPIPCHIHHTPYHLV